MAQLNCLQKVYTETKVYIQSGQTESNCNSILFVNTGNDNVLVDGLQLLPGQSWGIDGNRDEIIIKTYVFTFVTLVDPALTIIYKKYY